MQFYSLEYHFNTMSSTSTTSTTVTIATSYTVTTTVTAAPQIDIFFYTETEQGGAKKQKKGIVTLGPAGPVSPLAPSRPLNPYRERQMKSVTVIGDALLLIC